MKTMKINLALLMIVSLIMNGCQKQISGGNAKPLNDVGLNASSGATQVSGIGYFDATDACNSGGQGAAYAINMTGDLEGCLYTFVDGFECSPSGTYREVGREHFVGTYNGEPGSFWTNYKFEAKYEGCAENGSYVGAEIKGRCQHPIVEGSGTGVFEGATGWMAFKDDIEAGNFPYRGHLQF